MRTQSDKDLARRRSRRRKVRYLRERLARTTSAAERKRLIAKLQRISPTAPVPGE